MTNVRQYPHYLFAVSSGASQQDALGDWSDSPQTIQPLGACREETNGRGEEIQIAGGTYRRFSSIVYLPKGATNLPEGTEIIVCNDPEGKSVRIRAIVLKFSSDQLHSRIWL